MNIEGIIRKIDFEKMKADGEGVVPVVVQQYLPRGYREVTELFLATKNMLRMTLEWESVPLLIDRKYMANCGGPSVKEAYLDCDKDAVLLRVEDGLTSTRFSGFGAARDRRRIRMNKDSVVSDVDFSRLGYARKDGKMERLVPVAAVDYDTRNLLMVAYANNAALRKTIDSGMATYWSREREKLWVKGEESGNKQLLQELKIRLDGEALVYSVVQLGKACHVAGRKSCFDNGRVL